MQLATDLKKGERVRLIDGKREGISEVLEVAQGRFRTDFVPDGTQVFVFGREVNDFRTVDYEAIAMLNVSATQELARQVAAKGSQIRELEKRVAELEAKNASLLAAEKAREARLVAVERALGVGGPALQQANFSTKAGR